MVKQWKKEGFSGQKMIVIPRRILTELCAPNSIIGHLYLTDIGYYPQASYHYRARPQGADEHILIYCHQGVGTVTIGKETYELAAGDFVLIPRGIPHQYRSATHHPWTIYWLHFRGKQAHELVQWMFDHLEGSKGSLWYPDRCLELFRDMHDQLARGYSLDILIYVNSCLAHFLTTLIYHDHSDWQASREKKDYIDRAIAYFQEHLDQSLSLTDMATAVNLSASHFAHLFKKKTGFPPIEYFNQLKMQQACQYLLLEDMRVKEISDRVGITDPQYFSRLFTKVMGMSPRQYRTYKNHQQDRT